MDKDLPVCIKCGYKAQSENDPLLTSFNGMGECPECGAIPGKMAELKSVRLESDGITEPSMKKSGQGKRGAIYRKIMLIIPAIDLKVGQCVRLKQGLMAQATVFSDSPAEMARHSGVERL